MESCAAWVAHLDYEVPLWAGEASHKVSHPPQVLAAYTAQDDVTQPHHQHRSGKHNYAGYSERICDRNLMLLLVFTLTEARLHNWKTLAFSFLRGTSAAPQAHRFATMLQASLEYLEGGPPNKKKKSVDLVMSDLRHVDSAWVKRKGIDHHPVQLCDGKIGAPYDITFTCFGGYTNILRIPQVIGKDVVDAVLFYGVAAAVPPLTKPSALTIPLSDKYFDWRWANSRSEGKLTPAVPSGWKNFLEASFAEWIQRLSSQDWTELNAVLLRYTQQADQEGFPFAAHEMSFRAPVETCTVNKRPGDGKERWEGEDIKTKKFVFTHDDFRAVQKAAERHQTRKRLYSAMDLTK